MPHAATVVTRESLNDLLPPLRRLAWAHDPARRFTADLWRVHSQPLSHRDGLFATHRAVEGDVVFHPGRGDFEHQARALFREILPQAFERMPELTPGDIAILYPAAWIGDAVASQADQHGMDTVRTDGKALYPRSSRLMRWLEDCAVWCCGGWQTGAPRFSRLVADGTRVFAEAVHSDEMRQEYQRKLAELLWKLRDSNFKLHDWLELVRADLLQDLADVCTTLDDDWALLSGVIGRTDTPGDLAEMTLGQFAGMGDGGDRLNLSTLHSSKGREFEVVVLFGMDDGRIPRRGATASGFREARRLFYVGVTRAKREVHIMYTESSASPFVSELWNRLGQE